MNVLLIAPDFGLPTVKDEIRAISVALRPVILSGKVMRLDLIEVLREHNWDVLWFATHGSEKGIELSDGYVSVSDLTAVVRASGAWLVVLNTCSSRLVGLELHYELGTAVITTQAEIDDVSAFQTGALLAQALGRGLRLEEAFAESRPGQGHNYFLFNRQENSEADEIRTILMLNEWGTRLSSKIDGMERRVDREIGRLREDIDRLKMQIDAVVAAMRLSPWNQRALMAAFLLLFLPAALFYEQMREIVGISWQLALTLTALAYGGSAVLWAYIWWGGRDV